MKYNFTIQDDVRVGLDEKLSIGRIDGDTLEQAAGYFFTIIKMLDNVRKAYDLWLDDSCDDHMGAREFLTGALSMLNLLKKTMDKTDGIVGMYISRLEIPENAENCIYQPWQYSGHSQIYDPARGIFSSLRKAGLSQDFIDRYYLDGSLLEIHEACMEIVPALVSLTKTDNPNPLEVREGIFLIEDQLRKLYVKLYVEEFDDARGLMGVMALALDKLCLPGGTGGKEY